MQFTGVVDRESGSVVQAGSLAAPSATARDPYARAEWALLALGIVLLWTCLDVQAAGDSRLRWNFVQRLLQDGVVTATKYPAIGPLCSVPLWWIDQLLGLGGWLAVRFNLVLFGVAAVLFQRLLAPAVGGRVTRRFLLLLTAVSLFPNHLAYFNSEPFTVLLVGLGLAYVVLRDRSAGWYVAAVGVANTPASIVAFGLVLVRRALSERRLRIGFAAVFAVGLILLDMAFRSRSAGLATGYEEEGFTEPFLLGAWSILFSSGKGLVWFVPALLMRPRSLEGRPRELHLMWLLFTIGLVLIYAKWWAWHGGRAWGPRFFLFASLPACLALAAGLERRGRSAWQDLVFGLVVLWSGWVALCGAVFRMCDLPEDPAFERRIWFDPEMSVLVRPLSIPWQLEPGQVAWFAFVALVTLYFAVPPLMRAARRPAG